MAFSCLLFSIGRVFSQRTSACFVFVPAHGFLAHCLRATLVVLRALGHHCSACLLHEFLRALGLYHTSSWLHEVLRALSHELVVFSSRQWAIGSGTCLVRWNILSLLAFKTTCHYLSVIESSSSLHASNGARSLVLVSLNELSLAASGIVDEWSAVGIAASWSLIAIWDGIHLSLCTTTNEAWSLNTSLATLESCSVKTTCSNIFGCTWASLGEPLSFKTTTLSETLPLHATLSETLPVLSDTSFFNSSSLGDSLEIITSLRISFYILDAIIWLIYIVRGYIFHVGYIRFSIKVASYNVICLNELIQFFLKISVLSCQKSWMLLESLILLFEFGISFNQPCILKAG